jgi:hypothetical protein
MTISYNSIVTKVMMMMAMMMMMIVMTAMLVMAMSQGILKHCFI